MKGKKPPKDLKDRPRFDLWPQTGFFETEPKRMILGQPLRPKSRKHGES